MTPAGRLKEICDSIDKATEEESYYWDNFSLSYENTLWLIARVKMLAEALERIKHEDKYKIPCPDNKPGCAVYHFKFGLFSEIARKALEGDE